MNPFHEVLCQLLVFGVKQPVLPGLLLLFFESQLKLNFIRWYISFYKFFHEIFPVFV